MRRGHRLIAALLFAVLAAWPITAFASGVVITLDRLTAEPQPIQFTMPSDAVEAAYTLYLRNPENTGLTNLELLAFLHDAANQPVSTATVAFRTADDAALGAFNLAAGEVRPIRLAVGGLSAHGVFTGMIVLRSPGAAGEAGTAPPVEEVLAQFGLVHPGKVEIREEKADRTLSFESSAEAFSYPLTLRETTGEAGIQDLSVEVGQLLRTDGAPGGAGDLSVAPAGPFPLLAGGYRTITLTGRLPDVTAYRGWLTLNVDGQVQPYSVAITRSVSGRLAVLEAGPAGDVALNVRGPAFRPAITLRVPAGKPAITGLAVEVTGLSRQDGQVLRGETLACSPCGAERFDLAPGVSRTITLVGEGFKPSPYKAFLRLGYEGLSLDVPLTITREAPAGNIQVDEPGTAAVVNWGVLPSSASVPIHIREAQGQQVAIYYPDPGSLVLNTPDNRKVSAVADRVEILQRNDAGDLEPLPTPASPMTTLVVNGDLQLVYRLTGIGEAGTYQGKVTVAGPDSQSVTQDIEIQVKHGWAYAFLAILLGVLLSYFWHGWTREGRSRALLGRDIALTRESIEAIRARDADAAWGVFLANLKTLDQELRDQRLALTDGQARLRDIQSRNGHYGRARLAHDQALRVLLAYPAYPADLKQVADKRRLEIGDQLQNLRRMLENEGPLEQVATAVTSLENFVKTIREEAIVLPAQNLVAELQALIEQSADRPRVRAEASELKRKAAEIESAAADASQWDALMDRLRALKEAYVRLRIDLLQGAAGQLQASRAAAPEGQSQRVDDLLAELHRDLDDGRGNLKSGAIDAALASWNRANNAFLAASIRQLAVLASPLGHPEGMAPDQWEAAIARKPALRDSLNKAEAAWKSENVKDALEFYKSAQEDFLGVQIAVLKTQMAAFASQATQPAFLAAPDLDIPWGAQVGPIDVPARVADIAKTLPEGVPPGDLQAAYRTARVQFAGLQHKWLSAAYAVLHALRGQPAPAGFKIDSDEWQARIPEQLKVVESNLGESQDLLGKLNAPGDRDEELLLQAERRIHRARGAYAQLLGAFDKIYTGTRKGEAPGFESMVAAAHDAGSGPSAAAPAPGAGVEAGALSVAGTDAIAAAPGWFGAEPQSSQEWDDLIRGRDRLVFWIALFIATISGLSALYLANPTFGSLTHYITAILWGFGIQAGTQLATTGAGSVPKVGPALGLN